LRNKLRNRQQHEKTQAYLKLDSYFKRMRNFRDDVPKHYLETVRSHIKRVAKQVEEDAVEAADAAVADGDETTLRALEVEEAEEIELERQIAPADAIVEPYCEVEDVAENVLIDLLVKDGTL